MNLTRLRYSAAAAACVASIAVLGLLPARAGTGSDRVVRLTRCGPQRTDASTAPAHPYEETAPVSVVASQDIVEVTVVRGEVKVAQADSPVVPRRAPRSTFAAWLGALGKLSPPGPVLSLKLAVNDQLPFDPPRTPADGRAPPAS